MGNYTFLKTYVWGLGYCPVALSNIASFNDT